MTRTRTHIKYVKNLTPAEFNECLKLNMGSAGQMRSQLRASAKTQKDRAVLIKRDGKIVAWSLLFTDCNEDNCYVYVPPEERRKGYGSRLLKRSTKVVVRPYVHPWDKISAGFYSNYTSDVKFTASGQYWI